MPKDTVWRVPFTLEVEGALEIRAESREEAIREAKSLSADDIIRYFSDDVDISIDESDVGIYSDGEDAEDTDG